MGARPSGRAPGGDGGESNSPSGEGPSRACYRLSRPRYLSSGPSPPTEPGPDQPILLGPPLSASGRLHPGCFVARAPPAGVRQGQTSRPYLGREGVSLRVGSLFLPPVLRGGRHLGLQPDPFLLRRTHYVPRPFLNIPQEPGPTGPEKHKVPQHLRPPAGHRGQWRATAGRPRGSKARPAPGTRRARGGLRPQRGDP